MTIRNYTPRMHLVPNQHHVDPETRREAIAYRLQALERERNHLSSEHKWPTNTSLAKHSWKLRKQIPAIVISPPSPELKNGCWEADPKAGRLTTPSPRTLRHLIAEPLTPRDEFPVKISRTRRGEEEEKSFMETSFIYFQFLPIELRLQIWGLELERPKIIEAQFSGMYGAPCWVENCLKGSALRGVCRESREVALGEKEKEVLVPMQRDLGKRWSAYPVISYPKAPERPLHFVPERDTIFFRPLDHPASALRSLTSSIANVHLIEHLALPLPPKGLALRNVWKDRLAMLENLKTLTFMVGGRDQTWAGEGEIELRHVEEWLLDGRERTVGVEGWKIDMKHVGKVIGGRLFEERMKGRTGEWRGVSVRVVAWSKVA